jgi:hypothetical protein
MDQIMGGPDLDLDYDASPLAFLQKDPEASPKLAVPLIQIILATFQPDVRLLAHWVDWIVTLAQRHSAAHIIASTVNEQIKVRMQ